MPPTPARKLIRRCGSNAIQAVNYQPAVQIQQQGWGGSKLLNSTTLRALNITTLNRTLNENELKDLVQGIQTGNYGGVVQGIPNGNTGSGATQAIQNSNNAGVYLNAGGDDDCWDGHDHHAGLAAGAIVGIVIGVGLLLVLIIIAVWLKRKRARKGAHGGGDQGGPGFSEKMKQLAGRFRAARRGAEEHEEKDCGPETRNSASDPYMHRRGY